MKMNGKIVILAAVLVLIGVGSAVVQNHCFPTWSLSMPIIIDKDVGRVEFAPLDTFTVEASYKYGSGCKNYVPVVVTWQAFKNNVPTNDIVFSDKNAKKTTATVINGAQTGNRITIRVTLTFADDPDGYGLRSENETTVFITSRPPAPKINLSFGSVESLVPFKIGFEGSKAYGSSKNFIRNCSLLLQDEHGNVVSTDEVDTVFGKAMPKAQLKALVPGIHTIIAVCADSYGTIGTVTEGVPINLSTKRQNAPVLIVEKSINCILGDCGADYSSSNAFGKSITVGYVDVTTGDKDSPLIPCGDRICKFNITRPGSYMFKLIAKFLLYIDANGFHYSDTSTETIRVFVSQRGGSVTPAVAPYTTVQPTAVVSVATSTETLAPGLDCIGSACGGPTKTTPAIGVLPAIFALIILARKNKFQF